MQKGLWASSSDPNVLPHLHSQHFQGTLLKIIIRFRTAVSLRGWESECQWAEHLLRQEAGTAAVSAPVLLLLNRVAIRVGWGNSSEYPRSGTYVLVNSFLSRARKSREGKRKGRNRTARLHKNLLNSDLVASGIWSVKGQAEKGLRGQARRSGTGDGFARVRWRSVGILGWFPGRTPVDCHLTLWLSHMTGTKSELKRWVIPPPSVLWGIFSVPWCLVSVEIWNPLF